MVAGITGGLPINPAGNTQAELIARAQNLSAEITKVVAEYFKKCDEAIAKQDKAAFKKLEEEATQKLASLAEKLRMIPPSLKRHAEKLEIQITEAKRHISGYGSV